MYVTREQGKPVFLVEANFAGKILLLRNRLCPFYANTDIRRQIVMTLWHWKLVACEYITAFYELVSKAFNNYIETRRLKQFKPYIENWFVSFMLMWNNELSIIVSRQRMKGSHLRNLYTRQCRWPLHFNVFIKWLGIEQEKISLLIKYVDGSTILVIIARLKSIR